MGEHCEGLEYHEERAIVECGRGHKQNEFLWKLLEKGWARPPQYGLRPPKQHAGAHRIQHFPSFQAMVARLEEQGFTLRRRIEPDGIVFYELRRWQDGRPGAMVRRLRDDSLGVA